MQVDLLIHSAPQLLTLAGGPQRGRQLGSLGVIEDGALAIADGQIVATGASADLLADLRPDQVLDASGKVVMPGFVDAHTHMAFAGDRAQEFEQRIAGASYMEILETGGGILSTVRQTRQATTEALVAATLARAARALSYGTTTAEVKTGYGLDTENELRLLEVIQRTNAQTRLDLVPTLLAAHALPEAFTGRADAYVEDVCATLLPSARRWWQDQYPSQALPFVDVFCEEGVFSLEQSRRVLERARDLGFPLKIHVDEFVSLGGTRLAVELSAASADHLVSTPQRDIQALGRSDTVAVSLPCTPFGLGEPAYTPAQALLDANAILALATDLNPGTAWCESMQMAIAIACRAMRLTPAQAIAAATINAAAAISRSDQVGSLEIGKQADVLILDAPDYRHLGYRFGTNLVQTVVKRGEVVENVGD